MPERPGRSIQELKQSFHQGSGDPVILQPTAAFAAQLKDPCNTLGIKREPESN